MGGELDASDEVDERYCIEKSTQAACDFFNESYRVYKNWTLVAASYNMGKGGINKQIERQNVRNYYDLLLNEETARYIFRVIALKLILSSPEKFGYHILQKDKYLPYEYDTVHVDSTVSNFTDFAASYETSYKMLKLFNPWLRDISLPVKNKIYIIKIPKKDFRLKVFESLDDNSDSLQNE